MSDPTILDRGLVCGDHGYVAHTDTSKDELGNIFAAFVQERTPSKPGLLIRRRQSGTGVWSDVHWFDPAIGGKFGHSSLECKGAHLVVLADRADPATGSVRTHELVILNVCNVP